ncbi:hypothetical protein OsJ_17238 [Oryza sativa Japonica Group]|uniref:Uncharacterized protein n=1 Tax=Oryza sativa subsp. japonica TaxID=39947 RepID=B9FHQ1_ORYSJ|nr:hypothetical protein OsJ_17238 [Oryza sativa Japonica Group]
MSASSPVAYDANVLLAAVTALSAAIAFVAALHLYARCLLRRRVAGAGAGAAGNPHALRRPVTPGRQLRARGDQRRGVRAGGRRPGRQAAGRAAGVHVGVFFSGDGGGGRRRAVRGVPRGDGGRRAGEAAPGVPPRVPRRVHRHVARRELDVPGVQGGGGGGGG